MPSVLDSFLTDIYSSPFQQGQLTQGLGYRNINDTNIPEATRAYPSADDLKAIFEAQAKREAIEGEPSIGNYIVHGLGHVVNALSAGEYAVANAASAMLKRSRGQNVDVGDSFMKGLKAGFNDDERYKKRMFDLLTEYGWNPHTTPGKIGKYAVGFLAGVMVDPISYISFGPLTKSFAGMIGKNTIKRVAEEMGPIASKSLSAVRGEQFLNKTGIRIRDDLAKLYSQGSINPMINGLDKLKVKEAARAQATKDAMRLAMPLFDVAPDVALASKTITVGDKQLPLVDFALPYLGRKANKENREWFLNEGVNELFDKGGIKLGIPFTSIETHLFPGGGFLGPRSATLTGLLFGNAIKSNLPLMYRIGDKIKSSALFGATFGRLGDALKKHLIKKANLSDDEQLAEQALSGKLNFMHNNAEVASESLVHVDAPMEDFVLGTTRYQQPKLAPNSGVSRLTDKESSLATVIAHNISFYDPWLQTVASKSKTVKELMHDVLIDNPDQKLTKFLKERNIKYNERTIDRVSKVIERSDEYLNILHSYDASVGHVYTKRDMYFPLIAGERADGNVAIKYGKNKQVLVARHELERQLQGKRIEDLFDIPLGTERGNILIRPELDFQKVLYKRIASSYKIMGMSDWAAEWVPRIGRAVTNADSFFREVIESKALKEHPETIWAISEHAGNFIAGMRTGSSVHAGRGFHDAMAALNDAKTPGDVTKILDDFQRGAGAEDMLGKANVKYVEEQYDNTIKHWEQIEKEEILRGGTGVKARNISTTLKSARSSFLDSMEDKVAQNVVKEELKNVVQSNKDLAFLEKRFDKAITDLEAAGFDKQIPQLFDAAGITQDPKTITPGAVAKLEGWAKKKPNRAIENLFLPTEPNKWSALEQYRRIKIPDTLNPGKFVSLDRYRLRNEMIEIIANVLDPEKVLKERGGNLIKAIDMATEPLKRYLTGTFLPFVVRPAFFIRNFLDNFIRRMGEFSLAGDINPALSKVAFDISYGRNLADKVTLNGITFTKKELKNFMEQSGFWRYGLERIGSRAKELGSVLDNVEKVAPKLGVSIKSYLQAVKEKHNWMYQLASAGDPVKVGTVLDNWQMSEAMLAMMDRGMPLAAAGRRLSRSMFDYGNLTPTEQLLSRVFFFYNFQRQAIPFALEQVARRPLWFNAATRMKDLGYMNEDEEAAIPKWVRDYPMIGLGREGDKIKLMSFRNMFSVDVLDALSSNMTASEFVNKLNPILTAPFEFRFGQDLYLDEKIQPVKMLREERSNLAMSLVSKFVNAREVTGPDGNKYTAVDGYRWHALQRLYFSRMFRDLDSIGKMIEGKNDLWQSLMNLGLGLKVVEYDMIKQAEFLARDASRMKSEYNAAIKRGDKVKADEILSLLKGNL
jgi:hypothetical protein